MSGRKVAWRVYFGAALFVYGVWFAWTSWQSATCKAVHAQLTLRPGTTLDLTSRLFTSKPYYASFTLDDVTPADWHWWDHPDENLWHGAPPAIRLEVFDRKGRRIVDEASEMSDANDWIVTGSVGSRGVEVYKFLNLRGEPLERFRVRVTVLRGTPAAPNLQTTFALKRSCEFEGLLYIFAFGAITIVLALAAGLIALVLRFKGRAAKAPESSETSIL